MDALLPLLSFVAALIAAGVGYYGVRVGSRTTLEGVGRTLAAQREAERRRELRALQDARHQRLRAAYVAILAAGATARDTMDLLSFMLTHFGKEPYSAKAAYEEVLRPVNQAITTLNRARAELIMEVDDPEIIALIDGITLTYGTYMYLRVDSSPSSDVEDAEKLESYKQEMRLKIFALAELGRARLDTLTAPVEDEVDPERGRYPAAAPEREGGQPR
jgi:hypothetical protein